MISVTDTCIQWRDKMAEDNRFKEPYSRRLTSGILGYPHRKRIRDLTRLCHPFQNKEALDIGCGDLFFDKDIIPLQNSFIGIDLGWEDSLKRAKNNMNKYQWYNTDIAQSVGEYLPFREDSFDLLLSFDTLEHVVNEECCIKEITRVSKDGSILVIAAPIEFGFILLFKEIFRELISSRLYKGSWKKTIREGRYSLEELFYAVICRRTDKVLRVPHGHKGYDFRKTMHLLESDWKIKKKVNYPFNYLPDSLSYGCIIIFEKRA